MLCGALISSCDNRQNAATETVATPSPGISPATTVATPAISATPDASVQLPSSGSLRATAELTPTQGNNVRGSVSFSEVADGVRVEAEISGLTPGKHGFHIHENGDCSAPDGASAGGHFNPTNEPHGAPESSQRHDGDMGNIEADASGVARLNYVDHTMTMAGDRSIIGRAVIVHANPDDLTSQPSGDAGARVACGVIKAAGGTP